MDNNETDDLIVFWRNSREDLNLFVSVFYTNAPVPSDIFKQLTFAYHDDFALPQIFNDDHRSYFDFNKIVVGDFNNDGYGDFALVAKKSNKRVLLKFALNTSSLRTYEGLSFMTDITTAYPDIDWDLITKVNDKVTMIDVNLDGCVDYAHIGEASYYPNGLQGNKIKDMKMLYYMINDCKKAREVKANLDYSKKLIGIKWPLNNIPKEHDTAVSTASTKKVQSVLQQP